MAGEDAAGSSAVSGPNATAPVSPPRPPAIELAIGGERVLIWRDAEFGHGGDDPRRVDGGTGVIGPSGALRVMVATRPVDFRKGADGLAALVRDVVHADPFDGAIYVFRARRGQRPTFCI